jgi:hypothetical protein
VRLPRLASCVFGYLLIAVPVRAELVDLGHGLIYDTIHNQTWMQDTTYSLQFGTGTCSNGARGCFDTVTDATRWAESLVYAGLDDWRLPQWNRDRPEPCPPRAAFCGDDYSEISRMLETLGWHWGQFPGENFSSYIPGSSGPFLNFPRTYWLGGPGYWWSPFTEIYLPDPHGVPAWVMRDGFPNHVRTPEPATLLLVLAGAAFAFRRQRRLPRSVGLAVVLSIATTANTHAALIDIGHGLIYDTVQDLTWMQNTTYSRGFGPDRCRFGEGGCFERGSDAAAWAATVVYAGLDDWRLPAHTVARPPEYCPPTGARQVPVLMVFPRSLESCTTSGGAGNWTPTAGHTTPGAELDRF